MDRILNFTVAGFGVKELRHGARAISSRKYILQLTRALDRGNWHRGKRRNGRMPVFQRHRGEALE
eukprot:5367582-Lingulodinium_polyedra.AAC.1